MTEALLELTGVVTELRPRGGRPLRAVDGVDLTVARGEFVGLVGESGSGKTTLARTALRLLEPAAGAIHFEGHDITHADRSAMRPLRRRMQIVFQDAIASLSPRLRVGDLLEEPAAIHHLPSDERLDPAELLEMVELEPSRFLDRRPHELSGGQARRVSVARALALRPDLLVADEPTAGLDVSAAASILNLLRDLGDRLGLSLLLITHDLGTVGYAADRIAVMYLGQVIETGPTETILSAPAHPYTRALFGSRDDGGAPVLEGDIPSALDPPPGCRFHTRCPIARERCRTEEPPLAARGPDHLGACWFSDEVASAW